MTTFILYLKCIFIIKSFFFWKYLHTKNLQTNRNKDTMYYVIEHKSWVFSISKKYIKLNISFFSEVISYLICSTLYVLFLLALVDVSSLFRFSLILLTDLIDGEFVLSFLTKSSNNNIPKKQHRNNTEQHI